MYKSNTEYLESLRCDDIAPKESKKKIIGRHFGNTVRIAVFIVCFAVFVYAAYNLCTIYLSYISGDDYYGNLANNFESYDEGLTPALFSSAKPLALNRFDEMLKADGKLPVINSNEELEELIKVRNKLSAMKKDMPDLYGWINVEGTNMNYPVVYSGENSFYLDHAADKSENFAGAIFADMSCNKPTYATKNLILHGHNIRSWGMMFNGIVFFFEKPYFDSHKTIRLYTFDGIYEYTIISVREAIAGSDYSRTEPRPGQSMSDFIKDAIDNSKFEREGISYDDNSKLITLSTCSNYLDTSEVRFALVGLMTHSVTDISN